MPEMPSHPGSVRPSKLRNVFVSAWKKFCRLIVRIFYRRFEVAGQASIPDDRGLLLCANHTNALVDAVILQASTEKNIRPLARSGLFKNPLLKRILDMIGAVPIYRRKTEGGDVARNEDSFRRCYALFARNETLIIFPEGQSHSGSHLQELKTGAARMALGARSVKGKSPLVVPVGLTFSGKGRFRSDVLVTYGSPVDLSVPEDMPEYDAVHLITDRIRQGLESVTLNTTSWKDLDLVTRLERFFALRHGKRRNESLSQKFRAQQRLIQAQRLLQLHEPNRVRALVSQLKTFERLCACCGVRDYHLAIQYQPLLTVLYCVRTLMIVLLGFPVALWGVVNSYLPFMLTWHLTPRLAKGLDQYDTTKVLLGLFLFSLFWGLQTSVVVILLGWKPAMIYLISVVIAALVALNLRGEQRRVRENLRVFFLFLRKRKLKAYLQHKRRELEVELAGMVRVAKRLSRHSHS